MHYMRLIYKKTITLLLVFFTTLSLFAQNNFFSKAVESSVSVGSAQRVTRPERFNLVEAATQDLKTFLWSLPLENAVFNGTAAPVMTLPMPNGTVARFRVWQSSIQEPGLEAKFPEIKTFAGQGLRFAWITTHISAFTHRFFPSAEGSTSILMPVEIYNTIRAIIMLIIRD